MKIKKIFYSILITISAFQSIHCTDIKTIDLITAQPEEIAQATEPQTIKLLAAKAIDTGIANIPLANLEQLLAHETIAAKIVSRMNYINDITKENVHLFMQPIADNFDHVNEHTLDWILYVNKNNLKPVIPIITKNFITIAKRLSRHILLKARNNCPTSQEVVETTSVCLACFVWLAAITYAARYAARKFGFIQ